MNVGDIEAEGWRARGVTATVDLARDGEAELTIAALELPAPLGRVEKIRARCRALSLDGPALACAGGRFTARQTWLDAGEFTGELRYDRRDGRLELDLRGVPTAGGRLDLAGHWAGGQWALKATGKDLDLAKLHTLAAGFAPALREYTVAGRVDLRASLRHSGARTEGELDVKAQGLSLSEPSGRIATDGLNAALDGTVALTAAGTDFDLTLRASGGQAYVEPVFLDAGEHPLTADLRGRWNSPSLTLSALALRQPGVAEVDGRLVYAGGLREVELRLREVNLAGAYPLYLQPFLIGTPLDGLQTQGRLRGEVSLKAGTPERLALNLDGIALTDKAGRFALKGLAGQLNWQADPAGAALSELRSQGGQVLGLSLGPARLPLRLAGRELTLLEPVSLPVLDGALRVNTLRLADLGLPSLAADFDAELKPLDMRQFSQALGWPVFAGTLAGRLPDLSYRDGRLTVGGQLRLDAFDGEIVVDHLTLDDPLGKVPRLSADIALRRLDLKALTDTFSFGRIEGRLSGEVSGLRLVNWQPAAFDARFYTPENDDSRHRISQRAIQNISNIGGGGAGAILSKGFLSLFQDFAYDRIGISCVLKEDVCLMGGIGPAAKGQGYYLVRGAWLPRVDVIGFQREVSWPTLVEQLKSVTRSEGPVIQK